MLAPATETCPFVPGQSPFLSETQIDLAAWHFFHPCVFDANPAFSGVAGDIPVVKIFSSI
jgi:hypothetical protein